MANTGAISQCTYHLPTIISELLNKSHTKTKQKKGEEKKKKEDANLINLLNLYSGE